MNRRAASIVKKGERVVAETGVVVTTRRGIMIATRAIELGRGKSRVSIPKGAAFYVLHYLGEGSYAFWYKGKTYTDDRYLEPTAHEPIPVENSGARLVQSPQWEWWIRIRTHGQARWVEGNRGFDGADSCA